MDLLNCFYREKLEGRGFMTDRRCLGYYICFVDRKWARFVILEEDFYRFILGVVVVVCL